jgi:hypothetical protein
METFTEQFIKHHRQLLHGSSDIFENLQDVNRLSDPVVIAEVAYEAGWSDCMRSLVKEEKEHRQFTQDLFEELVDFATKKGSEEK